MSTTFLIPSSAPASSSSSSLPISGQQRGGMAIGVPASPIPSPSQPPPSAFPGSFGQQYGGSGRGTVGMPEAASNTKLSRAKPYATFIYWFSWVSDLLVQHNKACMQLINRGYHLQRKGNRLWHPLLCLAYPQIDPSEKLDPEVAAILADIAEDFVESAFSSDEIKTFRKPLTTDIHKERLAAIKKSVTVTEAANARNPYRHGTANARGGQAKTPAKSLGLYNF
ncbi:hypothetical protein YC2023_013117 [Brassica napus]